MRIAVLMTNTDESDFSQAWPKDGEKFPAMMRTMFHKKPVPLTRRAITSSDSRSTDASKIVRTVVARP